MFNEDCEPRNNHRDAVLVTRFVHSMDSDVAVQNQNFPGDGKEFTKVSGAHQKTKSHLYCQFFGIWQGL